ncbi:MAG TPA: hypothetical protein VIV63_04325 [Steroidobacteraceae bacterium]
MRATSIGSILLATLIGVGAAFWLNAKEARKPWPKATPPPPPSPIYMTSTEVAPNEAEIADMARDHNRRLEMEIGSALRQKDAARREAAFTFLLPELVQVDPDRVVAMVANLTPGEARDTLRSEVSRQWIVKDPDAAIRWMKSLPEGDRRASATTAIESIAAHSPGEARKLAAEFGVNPRCRVSDGPRHWRHGDEESACRP